MVCILSLLERGLTVIVDRHIMGAQNKRKGNALETATAKDLSKWTGHTFKRSPASGAWSESEQFGVSADVITVWQEWPYIVECKFYNSGNWTIENLLSGNQHFPVWVAQAVREGHDNHAPFLLVFRRNRIHAFVLMPYSSKIAKHFSTYVVSEIAYTSEVTGRKEKIKTITVPIDDLLKHDPNVFIHDYDESWESKIQVEEEDKKKVNESIDSILKGIDNLNI